MTSPANHREPLSGNDLLMEIRVALATDASVLATLASKTFVETFGHLYIPSDLNAHLTHSCSEEFFIDAMKQDDMLIAFFDGEPAGYGKAGKLALPIKTTVSSTSEIHRIYVTKRHQGKGIGAALMQSILQTPTVKSSQHVYLGVWEDNHRAQKFYAHHRFLPVGEYIYGVGNHADREIIMLRQQHHQPNINQTVR